MDISEVLGANLKRLRKERNLSLGQLAESSGLSKMSLSQIERGEANPTINTLWKIANGLGVSYSSLMEIRPSGVDIVRKEEVPVHKDESGAYRLGCYFANSPERGFEVYRDELDPDTQHETEGHGPGTEEFICLESGSLVMVVAGEEYVLYAGDAIRFDSSLQHIYRNNSDETAVMYVVNTYPRE